MKYVLIKNYSFIISEILIIKKHKDSLILISKINLLNNKFSIV